MGQSTDGILVFGIDLGEEYPESLLDEDGDEIELDDLLAKEAGLPAWNEVPDNESSTYYKKKREVVDNAPVCLIRHCSCDYPMYIIGIPTTHVSANRGYPTTIDPKSLKVNQEQIDAFKTWCESHDIDYSEPKWLLCSDWC